MQQEGYAKETIRVNSSCLRAIVERGSDLLGIISVKDALAKEQKWSAARKRNAIITYILFLKFNGMSWIKPKFEVTRKSSLKSMKTTFLKTRRRLSQSFQNPRLLRIHFRTFRHWKATMLYHQTKDPYYVKSFLGHKELSSTEVYIKIEHTLFEAGTNDQFTVRIAEKPEEIKSLLEVGFEYVCQKDTLIFLRKRK